MLQIKKTSAVKPQISIVHSVNKSILSSSSEIDVPRDQEKDDELWQWFNQLEYLIVLSKDHSPTLNEKQGVIINFRLIGKLTNHYALLKGLLLFGKQTGVSFHFDNNERAVSVEVEKEFSSRAILYFKQVFSHLLKEIRFKSLLRETIVLEEKIKHQQEAAYGLLLSLSY